MKALSEILARLEAAKTETMAEAIAATVFNEPTKMETLQNNAFADIARLIRALEKCVEQRDDYLDRLIERHGDGPAHGGKVADNAELERILGGRNEQR